jgi:hypothetical protein
MGRRLVQSIVVGLTLAFAPALAQEASVGIKAPSPADRGTLPSLQYRATQPSDDNYPLGSVRILYDPAFFSQFSMPTETPISTGRVGVAGWTTPNPPLGGSDGGFREVTGWFGIGLSVTWGGPAPETAPTRRAEPKAAVPSGPAR